MIAGLAVFYEPQEAFADVSTHTPAQEDNFDGCTNCDITYNLTAGGSDVMLVVGIGVESGETINSHCPSSRRCFLALHRNPNEPYFLRPVRANEGDLVLRDTTAFRRRQVQQI